MRAELATRNVAGIFSGNCPHCNEPILSDSFCGERFSCAHCSGDIQVQNYDNTFLFIHAPVTLLPRGQRRAQPIDPESYRDY